MSNGFRKGSKKPTTNLPSYSHALSGPALFSRDLAAFANINAVGKIIPSKQIPPPTQNSNIESHTTVDENTLQNGNIKVPEDQTLNNSNNNHTTTSSSTNISGSDIISLRAFLKTSGSSLKPPSSPSSGSCPTSPSVQKDLAKFKNTPTSSGKSKSTKRSAEQPNKKLKKMKLESCDSQSSTPSLQILTQSNPEAPKSPKLTDNNNNDDSQSTQNTQMYFSSSKEPSLLLQQKERQFSDLTQENAELKSSLDNLQSKLQNISHLLREIDPNISVQTNLQASIHKQLQSQMQEVKKSLEQSSKQKIRALEKKLSFRDEQHQLDQVKLLSIETEVESLRAKAHVSEGILNQLEQTEMERKQQTEKRLQLTIENEQLKMSLASTTQQVQSLEAEKTKMQSYISSLEQKLEESEKNHAQMASIIQKLQITLDDTIQKSNEDSHLLEQAHLENAQLRSLLQNEQDKAFLLENANQHLMQQLNRIDTETGWNGPTQYEESKPSGKPSNPVSQEVGNKRSEEQLQQLSLFLQMFQQIEQTKPVPKPVHTVSLPPKPKNKKTVHNPPQAEEQVSSTQLEQQLDILTMKEQERIQRLELHLVKTFMELNRARSGGSGSTIQQSPFDADNPLSSSQES